MSTAIDKRVVDEAMEVYLEWRERAAIVWDAYDHWMYAPCSGSAAAFLEYTIALDREECSSLEYAALIGHLSR